MSTFSSSIEEFINIAGLSAKIKAVETELGLLKQLQSALGGKTRGRKPGRPASSGSKASKPKKGKRGKRGALGGKILRFLSTKGKEGAHVKDIAAHVGTKPVNVTAWTYTTGKSKVKRAKPATFAIRK